MVEPVDAYNAVKKATLSDRPYIYLMDMFDCNDHYEFVFGETGSEFAHENIYLVDKESGKVTIKHFTTILIEGEPEGTPIDFSEFEKKRAS